MRLQYISWTLIFAFATACGNPTKRKDGEYLNFSIDCDAELSAECAERIIRNNGLYQKNQIHKLNDVAQGQIFYLQNETVVGNVSNVETASRGQLIATRASSVSAPKCQVGSASLKNEDNLDELYARPQNFVLSVNANEASQLSITSMSGHVRVNKGEVADCQFGENDQEEIPNIFSILKEQNLHKVGSQYFYQGQFDLTGKIYAIVSFEDSMNYARFLKINYFYQRIDRGEKKFVNIQLDYVGVKLNAPEVFVKQILPTIVSDRQIVRQAQNHLFGTRIKRYHLSQNAITGTWMPVTGVIKVGDSQITLSLGQLAKLGEFTIDSNKIVVPLSANAIELRHHRYNEYLGPLSINLFNEATMASHLGPHHLYDHRYTNRLTVISELDVSSMKQTKLIPVGIHEQDSIELKIEYIKKITH